ncbi:HNH endonuclease (plasmid) [Roseivivax marinus]|uniref:HNH endonuclease n=1 Tax=Roseivivax marinus TaxID=1379903 RepID=UPI001F04C99C|nr:HNH endonuclease [Roseivivax marinus]UMA67272.1 HNH endonuclease [Roseivivax marinus]
MPPLRKPALFKLFEDALRKSGLSFLRLSGAGEHPASYQIITGMGSYRLRVYIWNLTFGGRVTLPDEWRVQVTGLPEVGGRQRFVPEVGGKTVILGWCEDLEVFAAYDVNKHLGPLGGSPSIQIRQPALEAARINGLAPHFKGEEEVAFALKPAYLGSYLDNMADLHACGSSEEALAILEEICEDPESVDDEDIEDQVPEPRRYAVVSAKKALRDANFKDRVLTAYSHACAMCGVQLRLLDAAHILPAAHPDSTDETRNGIALCALHHRAYDRGLLTFDTGYRIHRNAVMERELVAAGLDGGLVDFQARLFPMIQVPPTRADRPASALIEQVNSMRGWEL